jgi:hypothetical protein
MDPAERHIAKTWVVHRQDDTGNRFVVRSGLGLEEAVRLAAELEARGHKQLYWVELERIAGNGREDPRITPRFSLVGQAPPTDHLV